MVAWVQPGEVLLHIGPHKTGTTALQAAFAAARPQLPEFRVRYPGPHPSHWFAAAAVMARATGTGSVPRNDHWERVLAELAPPAGPDRDRAVLSSEMFCEADDETAARVVAELGRPVRVVLTLRSLERLLPSTWQQAVKSTAMPPYERWLHRVLDRPGRAAVWRRFDTIALIERWGGLVGADRVCAVVVDEGDPGGMLRVFESLVGLPEGLLVSPPVSNRSMTAAEAETVRRVYAELADILTEPHRQRWLRRGGIRSMVERYRPEAAEPRIVTPAWAVTRARELQADLSRRMPGTGAWVIGDPAELVGAAPPPDVDVVTPEQVPLTPVSYLMVGALAAAEAEVHRLEARLARGADDLSGISGKALARELARRAGARLQPGREP